MSDHEHITTASIDLPKPDEIMIAVGYNQHVIIVSDVTNPHQIIDVLTTVARYYTTALNEQS